jgi:hypothetical protein
MPNSTGGLFHTMLAATSIAAEHTQFRNAFLDRIYWDYQPVAAIPFSTLTVAIPTVSEGDVSDIGGGPLTPTDTAHGTANISLDRHFSSSFVIKSWDKVRTPADLSKIYLAPRFEALKRRMNRSIAQLVTVANFGNYTLVDGATDGVFARTEIGTAWANLTNAGVPTDDLPNMSLITNVAAYSGMASATAFSSEAVVGLPAAEAAQQRALILPQFGARVVYDQHIANINAGKEIGILMHKYAIAGVTANPPTSDNSIEEMTVMLGDVPVQVQMQDSIIHQGTVVNIHCFWGVAVVRSDFGALLETD